MERAEEAETAREERHTIKHRNRHAKKNAVTEENEGRTTVTEG